MLDSRVGWRPVRFRASSTWFQPVWGPRARGQQFSSVVSASCRNSLGTCAGLSLCLSGNWESGDSARWGVIARVVLWKPRTYISGAETELISHSCGSPFTERFASLGLWSPLARGRPSVLFHNGHALASLSQQRPSSREDASHGSCLAASHPQGPVSDARGDLGLWGPTWESFPREG